MTFPVVPDVPGVPPLPRDPRAPALAQFVLLTADAIAGLFADNGPQWGIFLNGVPVIEADSEVSFDYKRDYDLSSYSVEQGAFETYNKVQHPFGVKVRLGTAGSVSERQAFLISVENAVASYDLYDIVTPEITYQSVNLTHFDLHREASRGVTLIVVDIWGEQVRVISSPGFSNTQQPGVAAAVGQGSVQPTAATPAQVDLVKGATASGAGFQNGGTGW